MVDNVVPLFGEINPNAVYADGIDTKDYKMDEVLEGFMNIKDKFDNVVIIGSSQSGNFYFSASSGDIRQILFDIESAKQMTMDHGMAFRPVDGEDE